MFIRIYLYMYMYICIYACMYIFIYAFYISIFIYVYYANILGSTKQRAVKRNIGRHIENALAHDIKCQRENC